VRWTEEAAERLRQIRDHLVERSPRAASETVRGLYELAGSLDRFPERGFIYRTRSGDQLSAPPGQRGTDQGRELLPTQLALDPLTRACRFFAGLFSARRTFRGPLRDPAYFARFTVEDTLVWPNGADFALEFLRERLLRTAVDESPAGQ
jgi:hypothetical protein